ncbi:phosphoesterase [Cypionkella aquatica]|uniref:Phosphoesterase n=1 Tax=Cypionkella aquatica TaxID=1756042 RepID=A0AA37U4J5_9RHOB|nr:phosphatase PAP2 family protein [Cypionkella aquatica]GLS88456.1 phosphoesterase [Cypionkella aquatica]
MPSNKVIAALVGLIGLTLVIFGVWPGIDLATSAYFHDANGFPVRQNPVIEFLRNSVWNATLVMPLIALMLLVLASWRKTSGWFWGYVLAVFLIGPGLVVNLGFKSHWGRARPSNISEFGGTAQFSPAWQISDQCAKNCSFVSGEGAGATALTITLLVILYRFRHRLSPALYRAGQAASVLMLAFVGWQRVAAGGHFLSDVLLSMLVVSLIAAILARLLLNRAA